MKEIYLDHASTTYVDSLVKKEMDRYFTQAYGNPGSFHFKGLEARHAIDKARDKIASLLNCSSQEIIFTGTATESINLALIGAAKATQQKGNHIITLKTEHKAVLNTCKFLEKEGFNITYLPVTKEGLLSFETLKNAITDKTILISITYANNEIGTINPIQEIGKLCKEKNIIFHTDACQAAGYLSLDTKELNVSLMTLNASKIYGPKGIGLLFIKQGTKIKPLIHGGGQEHNLRSGTENVPGIVGFAKALELAQKSKIKESKRVLRLREKLTKGILKLPKTQLNGHPTKRLPNNVNISILDIEGESLVLYLNEYGIYASTGSACTSASLEPSHVLLALGIPPEITHGSIRFTLGKKTKDSDINYVLKVLPNIVKKLRDLSPVKIK